MDNIVVVVVLVGKAFVERTSGGCSNRRCNMVEKCATLIASPRRLSFQHNIIESFLIPDNSHNESTQARFGKAIRIFSSLFPSSLSASNLLSSNKTRICKEAVVEMDEEATSMFLNVFPTKNSQFYLRVLLLSIIVWWLCQCVRQWLVRIQVFPRGPTPLPFIGNLLQIDTANPHRSMAKWRKIYGPIFTIWLPKPVIVIADFAALQQTLCGATGELFVSRPLSFLYGIFCNHRPGGDGIILCVGERWRTHRRFALTALRSFGMGGQRMERRINLHKDDLLRRMANGIGAVKRDSDGSLILNMHYQLAFCFGNIIHDLIIGHYYVYNDPEFLRFKKHIDNTLKDVASVAMLIVDCYPTMRHLLPQYYTYLHNGYALQKFFIRNIETHLEHFDPEVDPDNFIDAYLLEMWKKNELKTFSRVTLALMSGDLWTGGLETVVTTLTWAVLYFIHYPEVQHKLQAELDMVLEGRAFEMPDRNRLPYLRATIDELQRIVNVLPWHIPHCSDEDIILCNKRIPRGTNIMPQFGAVNFDAERFPNPENFDPERFLHAGVYKPCEALAPFGLGKRACLGENLARMELPIILTALIQNFHFEAVNPKKPPSLERRAGMTSTPHAFKCRIRMRGRCRGSNADERSLITTFSDEEFKDLLRPIKT